MIAHLSSGIIKGDDWLARIFYWPQALGWSGVDLFFVLSGFLITGILTAHRAAPNYFVAFYAHRTLRIFPPLILLLVTVLIVLPAFGLVTINPPVWPYWLFLSNLRMVSSASSLFAMGAAKFTLA